MKNLCPKCGKEYKVPNYAYRNAETYDNICLVALECCGYPVLVKANISFSVTFYTGDKTEDDWGNKIKLI